jgi:ABC-type amino acid transport substrate-binding protein
MDDASPRFAGPARASAAGLVVALLAILLTACGLQIPSDPNGTLDRVKGGILRVGVSVSGQLAAGVDGRFSGSEVDLVEGFARAQDATVEWTAGSEETLVTLLESGDLDVVIGGMTDETPWSEKAGITRGYPGIPFSDGRALVMLVPLGENRMLSTLEEYLDGQAGR